MTLTQTNIGELIVAVAALTEKLEMISATCAANNAAIVDLNASVRAEIDDIRATICFLDVSVRTDLQAIELRIP
jgi:hypothetical protein